MSEPVLGRFAPTPSGRMHLGNVFACLLAWLSARSVGGGFLLRMEDLDTQRTSAELGDIIREDLTWLGLTWDLETPAQSTRTAVYDAYFEKLEALGLLYPCYCTRSLLHSPNAPHLSDGTYVYPGTCRDLTESERAAFRRAPAWRVRVPDRVWSFTDRLQGPYAQNLATDCGDFVVRRADGVYGYQLAVTVDDALMGVTRVVRGRDLLDSAARQLWLMRLLGYRAPVYGHVPLLLAGDGRRLSKRERDLDMGALRERYAPETLTGALTTLAGLPTPAGRCGPKELIQNFCWDKIAKNDIATEL
ncbi:MAG: tRNA glutamyl-Q(34) synthetase GluQRS [Candidatus Faecousia sp.]|nr:tRNA glutamyl-Q(34) synthetase GluQRS [Candidatus Faecousia sp.]